MSKSNHIHKYKRTFLGGTKIIRDPTTHKRRIVKTGEARIAYRCILPGCKHKCNREEMEGREFICWNCGGVGTITTEMLSLAKPRHFGCRRQKESEAEASSASNLSQSDRLGLLT